MFHVAGQRKQLLGQVTFSEVFSFMALNKVFDIFYVVLINKRQVLLGPLDDILCFSLLHLTVFRVLVSKIFCILLRHIVSSPYVIRQINSKVVIHAISDSNILHCWHHQPFFVHALGTYRDLGGSFSQFGQQFAMVTLLKALGDIDLIV